MTTKERSPTIVLRDMIDLAAEDAAGEHHADGRTPTAAEFDDDVVATTRAALFAGVVRHRARLRERARAGYETHIAELSSASVSIPDDPSEQRQLVLSVFATEPGLRDAMLTVQHREFEELDDEEVARILRQLVNLGHFEEGESS